MDHKALRSLAGFLDRLSAPRFSAGEWVSPRETPDGIRQMPYVTLSEPAQEFLEAAYERGWLNVDFDWPEWSQSERAERLREDPAALASAESEDLSRLLTVCIRQDRFAEGALLEAFDSGLILRIVQRANAILVEEGTS